MRAIAFVPSKTARKTLCRHQPACGGRVLRSPFDSLLFCDDCCHSIAEHVEAKCRHGACACEQSREEVIATNIAIARSEHESIFHGSAP